MATAPWKLMKAFEQCHEVMSCVEDLTICYRFVKGLVFSHPILIPAPADRTSYPTLQMRKLRFSKVQYLAHGLWTTKLGAAV